MPLYSFLVFLYGWALRIAAPFHAKARKWADGRKGWRKRHRRLKAGLPGSRQLVWVHCASLGEFEQGRPIMEQLRGLPKPPLILLSFFSPSGYEIRSGYEGADAVVYLPLDTPAQANAFLDIWRPDFAIFVKSEFWFNILQALQRRHIPILLASGLFRPGQLFFRSWGRPFRRILSGFSHLFVQNQASGAQLSQIGIRHFTVAGDTRVDRVRSIAERAPDIPLAAAFCGQSPVLVVGSSWPEDEARLFPYLNTELPASWKVLLAPHVIKESHLSAIENTLQLKSVRYSHLAEGQAAAGARLLLIDNIGMLSALYQYGRVAYIGGGFKTGLHNTLEPIAFGLPVLFGPRYHKFEEARYLVECGGGFAVQRTADIAYHMQRLFSEAAYQEAAENARSYIRAHQGASQPILQYYQRWRSGNLS